VNYLRALPRLGPFVIPGRDPNNPRTRAGLAKTWDSLRDTAEIKDVHFHDLRRSFGLRIAKRAGLDIASKLLRHSSVKVTEKSYAPLGLDFLRPALDEGGKLIPFVKKADAQ